MADEDTGAKKNGHAVNGGGPPKSLPPPGLIPVKPAGRWSLLVSMCFQLWVQRVQLCYYTKWLLAYEVFTKFAVITHDCLVAVTPLMSANAHHYYE